MIATFFLQFKNAFLLGCQYSLIAIGFTLFFGVLNIVVFCTGDFATLFLFIASMLITFVLGFNVSDPVLIAIILAIVILISMGITGFTGSIVERIMIRPLRKSSELIPLVMTATLSILLQELYKNIFPQGSNPQMFPLDAKIHIFKMGEFNISVTEIFIIVLTLFIFLVTFLIIHKTKIGIQIQAISQDFEAAEMMGINVNRSIAFTFFLGAFLASIAGFVNGLYYSVFRYDSGLMLGIIGFSGAIVGGLGSIFGAIIGGFLIAFVETLSCAYIPDVTAYRHLFSFLVVIIFLVFKPSGILGRRIQEKV